MNASTKIARQELGRIVRERRLEHSLTQRSLAQKANLDYTYVSKIEKGIQAPSVSALNRIAEVLELPKHEVNELLALLGRIPDDLPVNQRRLLAMYYPDSR